MSLSQQSRKPLNRSGTQVNGPYRLAPIRRRTRYCARSLQAASSPSDRQSAVAASNAGVLELIGLLAIVCIWTASFVWQSADGYAPAIQWMAERLSISPAPAEKRPELAGHSVQSSDETKTITLASQPSPKTEAAPQREASAVAPMSPQLMQWIQTMVRELANLEHGIEQLKADQAQLARDTAEHLKEMQDQSARHNASLIETLKAEQSQMIRDSMNTGQQLKASQEQVAIIGEKIKAMQEQLDRLVTSDQQLRPKTLAPPQRPIVAPTPKPVLPPPAHL
jgi:hypothetical protein